MNQNQFMAALEELGGAEGVFPIPNSFPQEQENQDFNYAFLGFQADGSEPVSGRWSEGTSIDGKGEFTYHDGPTTTAPMPPPTRPDARYYGTTDLPNSVEKVAGRVQDKLHRE